MNNLKLGVEVASAHDLMAKDGQGSASPYVELHFDHQKFRTTVKEKDLDPYWNETFYFTISDPKNLANLTLDAYIYNNAKGNNTKSFMGKVHIHGTSFVPYSDAVVFHYPLEKRSIFSRVKGELGLKVFVTDNPSIRSSNPLPQMDTHSHGRNETKDSRRTFHHLPNSNSNFHQPQFPAQQPYIATGSQPQPYAYGLEDMRSQNQNQNQSQSQPRVVRMYSGSSSQPLEYALKETSPVLGGGQVIGGRVVSGDNRRASTYDLVEQMQFLFVRVVKAQDLPSMDVTGSLDPYVEVRVGNYKGVTQHFSKTSNPEWNVVFAFSRERMQATVLDVVVKDKDTLKDDFVGIVRVNLHDIPTRVPPDSPLAPEWYRIEDKKGEKKKGELMLAVWMGTQADEAFPDAFLADAAMSSVDGSVSSMYTRSKVYHSPRLWYVRVNVIEVQDLVWGEKTRFPDVYVKVQINNQVLRTRPVQARSGNALWNEEMMLVAAEPFEDHLILTIEDRMGPNKDEALGKVFIPLNAVERRADDRVIHPRWFNLQDPSDHDVDEKKKDHKFATRLHLRVCLDGGYHVLDESTQYSSDLRPTAKQLWKPSIGILELGILNASALLPMKTRESRGTTDAYCVAKYGHKWVRTRTVPDSSAPKFNEQYTWEVYDPATVLTVGVFDNSQLENDSGNNPKDVRIGKIRIRISTLETGRVYTHSYPLLLLQPSGVKKMGELHLAIRFSSTSMMNMMYMYSRPLLPKMHYVRPLTVVQLEMLRHQAVGIVAARLSRAEPPLRREIVEYMTDANSHLWSMRRSKANFFRLMSVFNGVFAVSKWFGEVCLWKNPITTVLVHVLFVMLVSFPELILPTVFLYMFLIGLWNYWFRAQYPPHMNTRLSYADAVNPDELDEEFDTFPTSRNPDLIRHRYDRLRSVAGRIQSVVGDIASQGERVQGLLSWRDPRATLIFMMFCLVAAFVLYATPFQVLVTVAGFYVMRHPRFRHRLPSAALNLFRRLPARTDIML
ncbi:FT-interacting protein 1-like [Cynara cardunculus var. scolymus]|uniref:C2 calcium-dependent membrane targeting n=1 Tax=Cynara cardunculus var. scolymus TaxID=59895 RepID=A0A103XUN8_CYNCS|nr:FT-interacting protein 1-like [Cynara cardunculus var. scolymus]KVH97232.1 C2 calcium-dependent membrane targeting [Cynara cardunculus var. scolymus]